LASPGKCLNIILRIYCLTQHFAGVDMVREDYHCIVTKYSTKAFSMLLHHQKNIHFFLHFLPLVRMWGQFIGNLPMEEVKGAISRNFMVTFLWKSRWRSIQTKSIINTAQNVPKKKLLFYCCHVWTVMWVASDAFFTAYNHKAYLYRYMSRPQRLIYKVFFSLSTARVSSFDFPEEFLITIITSLWVFNSGRFNLMKL